MSSSGQPQGTRPKGLGKWDPTGRSTPSEPAGERRIAYRRSPGHLFAAWGSESSRGPYPPGAPRLRHRPAGQSRPAETRRSRRAPRRQHPAGQSRRRRDPVGPPTPHSSASLLEQPGHFSEPLSHGEATAQAHSAGRGARES